MAKPIIGLTTYTGGNQYGFPITALMRSYVNAVFGAGGIPVLIPNGIEQDDCRILLRQLDGILLTGGGDIAIERYGGEPHARVDGVDTSRDMTEFGLLRTVVESGQPFLGICRGLQLVNVALKGTLFTNISDQFPGALKHDFDSRTQRQLLAHEIRIDKRSILFETLGETQLQVNSLHHQGIKDLADGLVPMAYAPDGLVEGVELSGHPFGLAVQWHPECLMDQPATQKLFKGLIRAASKQ